MVIENMKLRNIANLSIDKIHCFYLDGENLQVIDNIICEIPQSYVEIYNNIYVEDGSMMPPPILLYVSHML